MRAPRAYKLVLLLLIPALLAAAGFSQDRLNRERIALGITRGEPLGATAPPVLAFTTVALGGFRGLIANFLWLRAVELQDQGKYFEKVQLADWITKLQPHFTSVWAFQAWDMAYNISVKFDHPADRWEWVKRGIELLRDEALRFNPNEPLIYNQLAWLFQHKMGQDLDDAHMYYKSEWARKMNEVLNGTNYVALIQPRTDDERERARRLREEFKLDPEHMAEVDEMYGPLEWRLPESHAVYWATMGLKKSKRQDLIILRRTIYQPMQFAFRRGRLIEIDTPEGTRYQFGPNLALIPNVNRAYETMMEEDEEWRDHISTGHRNFLKDAVYFLYTHNRHREAQRWMDYLLDRYPDVMVEDVRVAGYELVPMRDVSLDEYAVIRVTEVVGETSNERIRAVVEGLLINAYYHLAIGEDDQGVAYNLLAENVYARFQGRAIDAEATQRIGLPPMSRMKEEALSLFEQTYSPMLVARLRTKLGLPPRAAGNAPPGATR
jgi:hypothetical protein